MIRAFVFCTIALFPCAALSQTTKPASMFSSLGTTVSTIFVGLLVVVVGYAIYTGIIKALRGMGWYNDPILDTVKTGQVELQKKLDSQATNLTNLTGVVAGLVTRLDTTTSHLQTVLQTKEVIGAEVAEIKKTLAQAMDILNHEDYGNRRLWDRVRSLREAGNEMSRNVMASIEKVREDTSSVRGHIKNEVFKERQAKAFETINNMQDSLKGVAKAVQTDDHLPMGQMIPATFCRHEDLKQLFEKGLRKAEGGIKAHRADLDKELTGTLGTMLVLVEQLVKRTDRIEDIVKELSMDWPQNDGN